VTREEAPTRRRVVVVGGGIAGLAAAHALRRDAPTDTEILVVDGAGALGGKLRVSEVAGVPVDAGAEMLLTRVPEGIELARAVGLGDELVAPATTAASVLVAGTVRPLPGGTLLGVPSDLAALRAAGVLSAAGVAAVEAEPDLPPEPLDGDVGVGEYAGRRLGREVVDRLVDPLLGGVYAGRAELLSLRATMPALAERLERGAPAAGSSGAGVSRDAGSPAGGGSAAGERATLVAAARAVLAEAGGAAGPAFTTLRSGLGVLPDAVARAAAADVRLGLPVRRVERAVRGFRVVAGPVPRPTVLAADAVVVAVPAAKAAPMLAGVAPGAATELAAIEYASMAIVTLAYPAAAAHRLAGSGVLVPATEGFAVKAVTYSSRKWPHLAGRDVTVVRASIGRYGEERVLHRDDDDLVALVRGELARLLGLDVPPVQARVTRWGGGLPQYAVGHVDRVCRIRAAVAEVPGLAVCGAAYDGVGVPACIRSGLAAAALVVPHLPGRPGPA
jgi:oxygen-dependent protoporphyrinogen oxidase